MQTKNKSSVTTAQELKDFSYWLGSREINSFGPRFKEVIDIPQDDPRRERARELTKAIYENIALIYVETLSQKERQTKNNLEYEQKQKAEKAEAARSVYKSYAGVLGIASTNINTVDAFMRSASIGSITGLGFQVGSGCIGVQTTEDIDKDFVKKYSLPTTLTWRSGNQICRVFSGQIADSLVGAKVKIQEPFSPVLFNGFSPDKPHGTMPVDGFKWITPPSDALAKDADKLASLPDSLRLDINKLHGAKNAELIDSILMAP